MGNRNPDGNNQSQPQEEIRVLDVIGCFLLLFGVLLLIPAATGKTAPGRMTNLLSALVLLAIGGGMFWRGVIGRRGLWVKPVILVIVLAAVSAVIALCLSPSTSQARGEGYSLLVSTLKSAGSAMKEVAASIPLRWVKIFTAALFVLIAGVVWLIRPADGGVFEGAPDRKRWRDLRLWTAVVMATQTIVYLLLGV